MERVKYSENTLHNCRVSAGAQIEPDWQKWIDELRGKK